MVDTSSWMPSGFSGQRTAPHGGQESDSDFVPYSTVASCPGMGTVKFAHAVAAYFDLKIVVADVKEAHPKHNRLDDPACLNPRKIAVMLNAFQAGSDQPRALALDTITNGLKDVSYIWNTISSRVLLQHGYHRSSGDSNVFYQLLGGDQGMAIVVSWLMTRSKCFHVIQRERPWRKNWRRQKHKLVGQ